MTTCTTAASKPLSTIVISQCILGCAAHEQHMESCEVAGLTLCSQEPWYTHLGPPAVWSTACLLLEVADLCHGTSSHAAGCQLGAAQEVAGLKLCEGPCRGLSSYTRHQAWGTRTSCRCVSTDRCQGSKAVHVPDRDKCTSEPLHQTLQAMALIWLS